jgi:threonine aldolase
MVTLSKGLAAPSGSLLAGNADFIQEAVRMRKRLGGGMRQVGILAAAGIVSLDFMIDRLAEDHEHARILAEGLAEIPGFEIDPAAVQTNIVIFRSARVAPQDLAERLKSEGVLCLCWSSDQIRMVTHLDVSRQEILKATDIARRVSLP